MATRTIGSLPRPTRTVSVRSGWHSFRHTLSAWGKEAGLELEGLKTLLRHEDIATTSNVYGDLSMGAKRRIQQRVVNFVKRQAEGEATQSEAMQPQAPVTIQ